MRRRRRGKAVHDVPKEFVERVRAGLEVKAESGCWLWKGCATDGYAQMKWKGKAIRVHRWMAALRITVEDGDDVHHLCGVTRCVNPEHLSVAVSNQHPECKDVVPF